ncbi:TetR/AcrR family transcriptional regulator [Phyllobacterium zundukense]|uniref:TetR family transcriptional regulator n=1 Tax=Phyllobacterium zundukense TaxID=1867719 RepID=A0A2N9VWL0_9HYPH|nr:TetR/AcrR family transcriptional regulator [Phyllobacterium zundukense]ATU93452.1 TetR family transcriptional regulator [Phyllobacterium zundukense]PIO43878.1 TetR family transcriptional regulator [Phyllobacterium zundukense]
MAKQNEKRDILIASAAGLFWHQGYAVTSLADIAAASGIPLGNIYYYFKSKAELARGVADIFVAETEIMLAEITEANQNPRIRLQLLVEKLAQSLKSRVEHGCPIALGIRDFRHESPEAAGRAAESFSLLIGFIGRELGRSGIRPSTALGLARNALTEWQGGIMLAHGLKDPTVLAESFRRIERLLMVAPSRT